MHVPIGARVVVLWTDGRRYSGTALGTQGEWCGVRFDGSPEPTWVPTRNVTLDGGLPEGGVAAAAAAGVPVYDEGAEVMASRNGGAPEACMVIEYVAARGLYNVMWNRDNVADHIPPAAIDPSSHHGLYGRAAQEELNNPTLPVGTHVQARRRDGRVQGGTITANHGDKFVCRWDGERARQWVTKEDVLQIGGVAPAPPTRPGELGLFSINPRLPPNEDRKDWYPDGDPVWARASEDDWWYEATVVSREWATHGGVGNSRYTIEWADGFGRTHAFDTHLRMRRPGLF